MTTPDSPQNEPKEASINMPSDNHQTFYTRLHSPPRAFTSIGLFVISYAILSGSTWAYAGIIRYFELGYIILMCFCATVFDPETAWTTKRRVGSDVEDGDQGRHFIKVKRPLVGFKACKYRVETPGCWGMFGLMGFGMRRFFFFFFSRLIWAVMV